IGLVIFTVAISVLANIIHSTIVPSVNASRSEQQLERIKPVAAVYVGSEGLAAAEAAASASSSDSMAANDSAEVVDGEAIYQQVCSACHTSGAAGAPKLEAAAWTERLTKGEDQLVSNAINGIGVMPAKGGRADLSDDAIRTTVQYMLASVGGDSSAANDSAMDAPAMAMDTAMGAADDIDGEAIYQQVCFACHGTGAAGAPKLEAGAWTERLGKGNDALVSSAINGIGIMPAKGGRADLSDDEVRATVEWMLAQIQ
ncbi:MAG: c-type cytochrome, partial [Xanthomonadales bacterium]|nr:c-type cytochrome [Xanthomonadales bacterium]